MSSELEDGRIPFAPTLVSEVGDGDARALDGRRTWERCRRRLASQPGHTRSAAPAPVAAPNYLIPVVAILLGWMYLGERPSILAVAGGSLCLVGVYVARHGRVKRRR
jgi:hypothetical protein